SHVLLLRRSPPIREPLSFPTRRSSDLLGHRVFQRHQFTVTWAASKAAVPAAIRAMHTVSAKILAHAWRWRGTQCPPPGRGRPQQDRKSTGLNSSHDQISYAVFCLKKKT